VTEPESDFRFESLQDRKSIIRYLDALKHGFESGRIILGSVGKKVILEPEGIIKLEVRVKNKDDRVKISLKCSWKQKKQDHKEQQGILTIET